MRASSTPALSLERNAIDKAYQMGRYKGIDWLINGELPSSNLYIFIDSSTPAVHESADCLVRERPLFESSRVTEPTCCADVTLLKLRGLDVCCGQGQCHTCYCHAGGIQKPLLFPHHASPRPWPSCLCQFACPCPRYRLSPCRASDLKESGP